MALDNADDHFSLIPVTGLFSASLTVLGLRMLNSTADAGRSVSCADRSGIIPGQKARRPKRETAAKPAEAPPGARSERKIGRSCLWVIGTRYLKGWSYFVEKSSPAGTFYERSKFEFSRICRFPLCGTPTAGQAFSVFSPDAATSIAVDPVFGAGENRLFRVLEIFRSKTGRSSGQVSGYSGICR